MSRPEAPAPRLKSDLVFGAVAAVALVLAVFFFVAGETDGGADEAAPPPITVVAPRSGAAVTGPFAIEFETPASMVRGPAGWTADGRYHLHAMVGGTELMAGADDVESLGGRRYRWSIPGLPPGEHRLRLQWSGPDHRTLREGGSAPFTLHVR
ncbi:MAG TPA: hypothetical protein VHG51_14620 [Longimicrobiaceae bacterium]|nr:hypothetical protein [Longimicrobiaceae bacterium]